MPAKTLKKIVVGMSGGVDSSIALLLLKKAGWDPVGVSLKYPVWKDSENRLKENVCCSAESFRIAKDVCRSLGVSHYIVNVSREFRKEVIEYFTGELRSVRTPNPCVRCNRFLKFKKLLAWGKERGIRYAATGHYARIRKNPGTGLYELLKARDKDRDQTYSLGFLSQEQLRHIVFPLGGLLKDKVYEIAGKAGFEIFLKRRQSQDFCFVSGRSMDAFLAKEIGIREGVVSDDEDKVIGKHRGLHFYTIGQRKGLGFSGGPYFVKAFDVPKNAFRVTKEEARLFQKEVLIGPCNFFGRTPKKPIRVQAKIRYRQRAAPAVLAVLSKDRAKLSFDRPQRAVTPGQFAVFYRRSVCLGAGEIR